MLVGGKVRNKGALIGSLFCLLTFFIVCSVSAHPGNTASDGCHYCRTNCDKWGEVYGERHCHGGSTTTVSVNETKEKSDDSFWLWAGGLGLAGYLGYKYFEDKKNR